VAVVLPSEATREERGAVYRSLDRWRAASASGVDSAVLPVFLPGGVELFLSLVEEEDPPSTLVARTWCERSMTWSSATPVALDRNPGDLRSSDPRKEAAAYLEAEQTIAQSCVHIGLPRPSRVVATPAAPIAGADKARHFPPYATGKPPTQRVLVHATLTFDRPIDGPVLLGAGRYLGLGLFRPSRTHG
jgi:CRISPR-associated protein Csb2